MTSLLTIIIHIIISHIISYIEYTYQGRKTTDTGYYSCIHRRRYRRCWPERSWEGGKCEKREDPLISLSYLPGNAKGLRRSFVRATGFRKVGFSPFFSGLRHRRGSPEVGVARAGGRVKGDCRHCLTQQALALFSTTWRARISGATFRSKAISFPWRGSGGPAPGALLPSKALVLRPVRGGPAAGARAGPRPGRPGIAPRPVAPSRRNARLGGSTGGPVFPHSKIKMPVLGLPRAS